MTVSVAIVLAVILTVPVLARVTAGRSAARTTVAAFAPVAAALATAATTLAAATIGWLAIVPAVPAVVLLGWQFPLRLRYCGSSPDQVSASTGVSQEVRILSLNALVGGASAKEIRAEVLRLAPDVLAIQELTPDLVSGLSVVGLTDLLPYSELDPRPGAKGIGVWSRWQLVRRPAVPDTHRPMPRLELDCGVLVTMTLVHPEAPLGARQQAWRHDLDRLLSSLTEVAGHHLLIGDFNATRDNKEFRHLLAAKFADCADMAAIRPWPGFTWPASRWLPPLLRLDHVLVSRSGAVVIESRTVRVPGTDHLGVFAVIELCRGPRAVRRHASG
ncbi:MAG TPA: endonuclease/exonuclease/phosphatase family protein [Streptosporangiaceae bacterium]|nr:endonuclease/exonuclease/phosphatase family protein [Streptosporangiaceae bacterium]